jgi:hypothetical protein
LPICRGLNRRNGFIEESRLYGKPLVSIGSTPDDVMKRRKGLWLIKGNFPLCRVFISGMPSLLVKPRPSRYAAGFARP